ncbi:hypothetical protein P3X46_006154 [Hevea brasiliensis]|uniref:Major facilitator superfamily (MFS) profile domain-containing protein n=1 Tax=Hevea brasiliensis TaxID=3981 RepID=A0ABQ9MRX2_HEVBR|nr:hypothetical protein P3X46_006154 [Hevea brasiliensis]
MPMPSYRRDRREESLLVIVDILGLSRLVASCYLKDDLHLNPAELCPHFYDFFGNKTDAVISGFSSLPWLVKPLYGFISDSVPVFGYQRRSYLVLSGLLCAVSSITFFCLLRCRKYLQLCEFAVSMVVERYRGESQSFSGSLQSLCWVSSAFDGIVSSYFSGFLVDAYGVRFVFGVTALLPLITSAVAVLVKEQHILGPARGQNLALNGLGFLESSKLHIVQLWDALKQPNVFFPTLFIFLWQATPQSDSALFYFTYVQILFHPRNSRAIQACHHSRIIAWVGLYNGFMKNVPLRNIFVFTTLSGTALGMTWWFAIGDSLILTVLAQASFMPVLVLAVKLCPERMEATLFATLMSVSNGGSVHGGLIGAGLTQLFGVTKDSFDNLAFWLFCAISAHCCLSHS